MLQKYNVEDSCMDLLQNLYLLILDFLSSISLRVLVYFSGCFVQKKNMIILPALSENLCVVRTDTLSTEEPAAVPPAR